MYHLPSNGVKIITIIHFRCYKWSILAFFFTFYGPCIVIHLRNKNQQDAQKVQLVGSYYAYILANFGSQDSSDSIVTTLRVIGEILSEFDRNMNFISIPFFFQFWNLHQWSKNIHLHSFKTLVMSYSKATSHFNTSFLTLALRSYKAKYIHVFCFLQPLFISFSSFLLLCHSLHDGFNPLNTKRRLLHLKTQFVPRSKHFSSRL